MRSVWNKECWNKNKKNGKRNFHNIMGKELEPALKLKHPRIDSSCGRECIMISSLHHFSSFDHDDIIGMSHGLKPMSDDDNSSSLEEGIESLSDSFLTE